MFAVLAGLALTGVGHRLVTNMEERRIEAEFMRRAEGAQSLVQEEIDNYEAGLLGLRGILISNPALTREEFSTASLEICQRYPGIAALEWAPIVPAAERIKVEATAAAELGKPYKITERTAANELTPASDRTEYLPILYIAPAANNERALGFDLATGQRKTLLAATRQDGKMRVSGQIHLVQEPDPTRPGMVWSLPVRRTVNGQQQFVGFVEAVFYVRTMLEEPFRRHNLMGREALFVDADEADPEHRVLGYYAPDRPAAKPPTEEQFLTGLHSSLDLTVGERHWLVHYRPGGDWLHQQRTEFPLIVLIGGLVITGLLGAFVETRARQVERIERTVAERTAELRTREEELRGIMENSPSAISVKALDGRYLSVNQRFAEWHGRSREEIIGRTVVDIVTTATALRLCEHDDLVVKSGEARQAEETFELGGRIRNFFVIKFPLRNAAGTLHAVCTVATDISDQKQTEAERLAVERKMLEGQKLESLGVLAGGIAHDFNNLLTGVLGHASLAEIDLPPGSPALPNLRQIEAGALRAAELCRQLLAYSGRGRFVVGPLELSELVRSTVPLLQLSISKQAALRFELAAALPAVLADASQLRQILMNLVINASDAIGSHPGTITITTGLVRADPALLHQAVFPAQLPAGELLQLAVTDTGCGMTPEIRRQIFDPFFSTKFTGRGLGLAAVLGIVRGHHGALLVESTPGQGSTFRLLLPPDAPGAAVPPPGAAAAGPALWRHTGRMLLVDDEAAVREVTGKMLAAFGLKVDAVEDGTEALARLAAAPKSYTGVLLDLSMPGINGDEVLRRIRAESPDLPVLLMSGYVEQDALKRFGGVLDAATRFLQKPFAMSALREKLRLMLPPE